MLICANATAWTGFCRWATKWIASLPASVQPLRLAMQYPRLVNLIAVGWNNPAVAGTLLTDLLNGDRGDRGFLRGSLC